jgi:hypothetical protein
MKETERLDAEVKRRAIVRDSADKCYEEHNV